MTGETGIGKSALLRYAASKAGPARVLTACGVAAETALPFAGLHGLLRPVLEFLPRIPPRQAEALASGFALAPPIHIDLFAVAAGTLNLLAAVGRDDPVLVLVDDLDMLDVTSRQALLFVARRATVENVAMVLATSAGEDDHGQETGLPCHHIPPLDPVASRALLQQVSPAPVAPAVADRLVTATAGIPLALVELPAVLNEAQWAGEEPLRDPAPVGPRVRSVLAPRLAGLEPAVRSVLLAAAAAGDVGFAPLLRAIDALGMAPEALEAAEASGLISLEGDRVTFGHPLMRSVVYHEATLAERRAVHRELADVTHLVRRAWHLGIAALGPDEGTADELEHTVAQESGHLRASSAAQLMERAAELTVGDRPRARRCVGAAELWQLAGAADRVRELLDEATRLTDDLRVRGHVQAVLGREELRRGRPVQAHRLLVREAARVRGVDPIRAASMLLDAADACCLAGDTHAALVAVRRARSLAGHLPEPLPAVLVAQHAAVLAICGNLREARALLDGRRTELEKAVLAVDVPTGWRRALLTGFPALLARLGELESAREILDEEIAQSRGLELYGLLPSLLVSRAELSLRIGDWDGAHAGATEAACLAERVEQASDVAYALACLARLAAGRGLRGECGARLDRARDIQRRCRLGGLAVRLDAAEGLLELGDGNHEAAFARLAGLARQMETGPAPDYGSVGWLGDYVEAAVQVARPDEARRVLAGLRQHAPASVLLPPVVARCHGLLAGDHAATGVEDRAATGVEERLAEAVESASGHVPHNPNAEPFERARAELCLGEWLRRRGRRTDAGLRLHGALATFEELGAGPWARRVRRELDTLGVAVEPPVADDAATGSLPCLTAQENRVAMLVGRGATNREAASALFLSTKTIEFHLRGVFRKLGVRSRAELAHLIGKGAGENPRPHSSVHNGH